MKKTILPLLAILLVIVSAGLSLAQEEQPKLLNHQFYGEVIWAKDSPAPSKLTAKLGNGIFTSEIRSSPCIEDPCKGRYGYDSDNTLRVQGESGTIFFTIDGAEVGEYQYQEDKVTKLDFDLRSEESAAKEQVPSDENGGEGQKTAKKVNESKTVNETVDEGTVDEVIEEPVEEDVLEVVKRPEPIKAVSKEIPKFQMPAAAKEAKKEGINLYLIVGVVLIVAAIGVIAFLVIKKRREATEEF